MLDNSRYRPPEKNLWGGRDDGPENPRMHQTVELVDLRKVKPTSNTLLLGFCSDAGVRRNQGRAGAAEGPKAFRSALGKLPNFGHLQDCGDITCDDDHLEESQKAFAQTIATIGKQKVIIGIGGGHEIAWGHYQGLKQIHEDKIGIINIDAHFDLRPLMEGKYGTSGTSFLQIADNYPFDYTVIGIQEGGNTQGLFAAAEKLKSRVVTAREIFLEGLQAPIQAIEAALKRNEKIYLSICLDVFAAPFAPGVSAPQALGLFPWQVIPLVETIIRSGKVVGIDIAELNPSLDKEGITASLAASLAGLILKT